MNRKLETNSFILVNEIIDSDGDSTWVVTKKKTKSIFYIHVFGQNHINIKLFKHNNVKNAYEAIRKLCNELLSETGISPTINIYYKNKSLIYHCTKAGFRKIKNVPSLYIYKKIRPES